MKHIDTSVFIYYDSPPNWNTDTVCCPNI